MPSVLRGNFKSRVLSGPRAILYVGDSITQMYQAWSMAGECNRRWPIECLGSVTGFENSFGNNWPTTGSNIVGATNVTIRPGEAASNGEAGWNLFLTKAGQVASDLANFGSPVNIQVGPNNSYNSLWDRGRSGEVIVVARTAAVAANPDQWRIEGVDSNNATVSTLGPTPPNSLDLDQAEADRIFRCAAFAVGTNPTFNTRGRISTWNETETGAVLTISSIAFKLTDAPRGLFHGYAGHGSWGIRNHSSEAGATITADPPTYTGRYDDVALASSYEAHRWEIVLVWIGANDAALTKAQFKTELGLLIARHRSIAATKGLSPIFVFVSQYDLSDSNTLTVEKAEAMQEIAEANSDVEFVDVREAVGGAYGSYSEYSSLLQDGVHPSTATSGPGADFRKFMADQIWTELMSVSLGVPTLSTSVAIGVSPCF